LPDEGEEVEDLPDLIVGKMPPVVQKKSEVASKLAARTEYTKTEIQNMLQSMEERLSVVERDLAVTDESGQNAVDIALDQQNFASLHKQYETIRAELINTLNS
jgi:cob(I)alamin adenosyltransferase